MTCPYSSLIEGHGSTHDLFENVHGRKVFISKARPRPLRFIVLPFVNPLLNCINLMMLLYKAITNGRSEASKNAKIVTQLAELKERYGVCWKYHNNPLHLTICNQKTANNSTRASTVLSCDCQCGKLFPELIDPSTGHARGMGPKFSSDSATQRHLNKGLNHRMCDDPLNLDEAMKVAKQFWIATESHTEKLLGGEVEVKKAEKRFNSYVKLKLKAEAKRLAKKTKPQTINAMSIAHAKNHLAITRVDKAANTIGFECIKYHQFILWERATKGENFKCMGHVSPKHAQEMLTIKCKALTKHWLNPALIPNALPYLTSTIKFHKDPVAYRFITPMHNSPLAPITKLVGDALQHILTNTWEELCHRGEMLIKEKHGIIVKLNWRVTSMQNFMLNLPSSTHCLWGGDIDQCYEKPPLFDNTDSLFNALEWFLKECFQYETSKAGHITHLWFRKMKGKDTKDKKFIQILGFSKDGAEFKHAKKHKLKLDHILTLCRVILENLLFQVGDTVFKQLIGFPMGCHPSSTFCDIYFCHKEYLFIWKLISRQWYKMAEKLNNAFRYQDDIIILNNQCAMSHFDPMQPEFCVYPMHLVSLKDTTLKHANFENQRVGVELTFLSAKLSLEHTMDGGIILHTQRYEKVRELPFDVVKFTHRTSVVPQQALYNIIGTHLSSTALISSHLTYFLEEVPILIAHLKGNALHHNKIRKSINNWASETAPSLPLKFNITTLRELLNHIMAKHLQCWGE